MPAVRGKVEATIILPDGQVQRTVNGAPAPNGPAHAAPAGRGGSLPHARNVTPTHGAPHPMPTTRIGATSPVRPGSTPSGNPLGHKQVLSPEEHKVYMQLQERQLSVDSIQRLAAKAIVQAEGVAPAADPTALISSGLVSLSGHPLPTVAQYVQAGYPEANYQPWLTKQLTATATPAAPATAATAATAGGGTISGAAGGGGAMAATPPVALAMPDEPPPAPPVKTKMEIAQEVAEQARMLRDAALRDHGG